jgi:diamine N-acetyltransferase
MTIIKAGIEHAALISKIGVESFLQAHGHSASKTAIDAYVAKTYTEAVVTKELSNPNNLYHLIYSDNKIAGYSKIILNQPNTNVEQQNITKLERFYLLKEFYGQNIGAKLFEFNVALAKNQLQAGMWLYVWVENEKAIRFYTKCGFKNVGSYDFKISENHSNPNHVLYLEF